MAEVNNTTVEEKKDETPKADIPMEEVKKHRSRESAWIVIHGNVYDVSKFLDEHPGGEEVLLEQAGKDGSEAFDDVGHSTDARAMMNQYKIGELCAEDKELIERKKAEQENEERMETSTSSWRSWLLPVALAAVASLVYRFYMAQTFASSARH